MDWSKLLETVLTLALPPLVTAIVALLVAKIMEVVNSIKQNKPDVAWVMDEVVGVAVRAAEQMKLSELITDKKEYAMAIATKWLLERGIKIDLSLVEAAIEAAVLKEFNSPKE